VALDDVSQSVLQGQVLLTLVHEATAEAFAPVRQALEVALEPLGAVISSAALTAEAWDRWAQALQEPRIIVTVLARRLGAAEFAALTAPLPALGLRVEALRRLSSPAAAQATPERWLISWVRDVSRSASFARSGSMALAASCSARVLP
jgi:hypothetical protein